MRKLRHRAWVRWQAAAGPWRRWAVCHVLTAPDIDGVMPRASSGSADAEALAEALTPRLRLAGTAIVLDLDPTLGGQLAARVNRSGLAHTVLMLPRWAYASAILPVDDLLGYLLAESTTLREGSEQKNVVFVLDAERDRSVARAAREARADNRYRLLLTDLPTLADLRREGIQRLVKISRA